MVRGFSLFSELFLKERGKTHICYRDHRSGKEAAERNVGMNSYGDNRWLQKPYFSE